MEFIDYDEACRKAEANKVEGYRYSKLSKKYEKLKSLYNKIRTGRDPLKLRAEYFEKWFDIQTKELIAKDRRISDLNDMGCKLHSELTKVEHELRSLRAKHEKEIISERENRALKRIESLSRQLHDALNSNEQ